MSRDQESNVGSNVTYKERPFSDLIEVENRSFVFRRVLGTLLGGYRTHWAEEEVAPLYLHIFQVLILLIMPVFVCLPELFIEDLSLIMIIGGVVPMILNAVF